jgi:site-specific recombinase XerD
MNPHANENLSLCESFIRSLEAKRYRPNTIRSYKNTLKHYLADLNTYALSVKEVRPPDLMRIAERWLNLPTNSYNHRLSQVRRFHEWLVMLGEQTVNPVISSFYARPERIEKEIMTKKDDEQILTNASYKPIRVNLAVRLMRFTGIRVSELQTILRSSIEHFDNGSTLQIDAHKFSKSRIVVLQDPLTIQLLKIYLRDHHVFGKYLSLPTPTTLAWFFQSVEDRLSFAVRSHDLRRFYATELAKDGVPVPIISRLLGHENLATTENYIIIKNADIFEHFGLIK